MQLLELLTAPTRTQLLRRPPPHSTLGDQRSHQVHPFFFHHSGKTEVRILSCLMNCAAEFLTKTPVYISSHLLSPPHRPLPEGPTLF